MGMTPKQINTLIRERRSIYPNMYSTRPIEKEIISEILENANWAPTHRKTEPWRFKVFMNDSRQKLSDYLGQFYQKNTPQEKFSEIKYKKTIQKPLQSACIIAICMQRDPKESVPLEEEIAAVAMAVQNMWLTCSVYGIGSYWSSPKAAYQATTFLQLNEGERCLGFFYMGYYDGEKVIGKRESITKKIEWM